MVSKIYAVRKGRVPGIYFTWDDCKAQTDGFPGAKFKSFPVSDAQKAVNFVDDCCHQSSERTGYILYSTALCIYTDGSYNKDTKMAGYGAVILTKEIVSLSGQVESFGGQQVNGELEAVKKAIDWAIRNGYKEVRIYHDYTGVSKWANGEWKTNTEYTKEYYQYITAQREVISVSFEQVPAHSGDKFNEMADKLARSGCGT